MPTDLDRLHATFQRHVTGRQSGKTHMSCHLVVGAALVGHKTVFMVIPALLWLRHVAEILERVFQEYDIAFVRTSQTRWVLDGQGFSSQVLVVPAEAAERNLQGYNRDLTAIVDFTWEEVEALLLDWENKEGNNGK